MAGRRGCSAAPSASWLVRRARGTLQSAVTTVDVFYECDSVQPRCHGWTWGSEAAFLRYRRTNNVTTPLVSASRLVSNKKVEYP